MQNRVELPPDAYVVGLDVSAVALARNEIVDEAIIGDIETYPLPNQRFDLVVCHDVLEHLSDPVAAVRNLARSVAVGGELDVQMPILWSDKGLVTRLTPHRFHVWCYRVLFRIETAGREGYAPFPTKMRITPKRLESELAAAGLELVERKTWRFSGNLPSLLERVWQFVGRVEGRVLRGGGATDYRARFRRRPSAAE
jgi:SAM-dependent methyltransferase